MGLSRVRTHPDAYVVNAGCVDPDRFQLDYQTLASLARAGEEAAARRDDETTESPEATRIALREAVSDAAEDERREVLERRKNDARWTRRGDKQ